MLRIHVLEGEKVEEDDEIGNAKGRGQGGSGEQEQSKGIKEFARSLVRE